MANVRMLPEAALTGGTTGQVLTRDDSSRGYGWADPQGGGGGGTSNYNQLTNKPQIGGVTLQGNKTAADLSLVTTSDSRLTDARTPTAHKSSHATNGADALTPADIGAVPTARTINGNPLTADISLNASDVNALASNITHLSGDVPVTRKVNNQTLDADITLTAANVGADPAGSAATAKSEAIAACDPAGAAATAKNQAIAACDPAGSAASAVSGHNTAANAHSSQFAAKQDTIGDLATIRSGAAAGATAVQPSAMSAAITADVTHAKGASAGGQTASSINENGVLDVSNLFSGDNTSLMGVVRYDLGAPDANGKMADRTTNAVTITSSAVTLSFPDAVSGKARDFLVYVDASGWATGGSLTINLPQSAVQYGDAFPPITAAGKHLVAITEVAANTFYTRTIELKAPQS